MVPMIVFILFRVRLVEEQKIRRPLGLALSSWSRLRSLSDQKGREDDATLQEETKLTSFIGGVAYLEGQPRQRRLDSS